MAEMKPQIRVEDTHTDDAVYTTIYINGQEVLADYNIRPEEVIDVLCRHMSCIERVREYTTYGKRAV